MTLESKRDILSNRKDLGFTLVELLVVVAIISLLLGILLPAFHMARIITKRVVCKSNLKQIAIAWEMYLDDHGGSFYQGRNADVDFGGWEGTHALSRPRPLNKYLSLPDIPESESQAKVFRCPADVGKLTRGGLPIYSSHGTSYRTNHLLIGPDRIPSLPSKELTTEINKRLGRLNINRVDNPSELLLVGDNPWVKQWWPTSKHMPAWHGRCCHYNLAFLDCHVEFKKIHKGLYVTDDYTVLPFRELWGLARRVQEKVPCPECEPSP